MARTLALSPFAALWRRHLGGRLSHRIAARWLREPRIAPGAKICIFIAMSHGGKLLPHSVDHARAWQAGGYEVIAVVVTDSLDSVVDTAPLAFAHAVMLRVNKGYDFGGWAAVIRSLGRSLSTVAVLALANDSTLGPSARFDAMLDRVDRSDADVIGLTESRQVRPHFQSYVLFFKARALHARSLRRFWSAVRSGGRDYVIAHYETTLLARAKAAALRTATLFPSTDPEVGNPTLTGWRNLLEQGFPYIKVQLLRDNPSAVPLDDWRSQAEHHGFALDMLDRQIVALQRSGTSRWKIADD